jgi:WD40 repeat protein
MGMINGSFIVLDNALKPVTKRADRRGKAIQCIKFNPDDSICAVGAHDSMIFTYDVKQKFKPLKKLRGSSSTIEHLDWTESGQTLLIQSKAYELLYYNGASGKREPGGASANKDEQWASWSCTLGWAVQGIWHGAMDGSDINSVSRSPDCSTLASADDFGFVNLYRWPCPVKDAAYNKQGGHSSHVTNVKFTLNSAGQTYLVSTGGEDKCIFQWRYETGHAFGDDDELEGGDQSCPPFDDGEADYGNSKGDEEYASKPKPEKKEP